MVHMRSAVRAVSPRLLALACSFVAVGCGSSAPIMLHPKMGGASYTCPAPQHALQLGNVVDRRGYDDPSNVGFTQTGMFNVKASLRTAPSPTALVRQAVARVLKACKPAAERAAVVLDVLVARFQTTETTGWVSEEIVAEIGLQVRAHSADGTALGTFDVKAEAKESGVDTTGSAEQVITSALAQSAERLARALAALSRRFPASAPSTPTDPAIAAAAPAQTAAARIRASARRLTAEREDELFEDRLVNARLIPIEIDVEVIRAGPRIDVRRDGISARFSINTTTVALDPRKVQEVVRMSTGMYAFGAGGAAAAAAWKAQDDMASEKAGESAFDVARLDAVGRKLAGLLFFTSNDPARISPTLLHVELLDPTTGRVERLVVPIDGAHRP